jgi:Sporulation and spore germination
LKSRKANLGQNLPAEPANCPAGGTVNWMIRRAHCKPKRAFKRTATTLLLGWAVWAVFQGTTCDPARAGSEQEQLRTQLPVQSQKVAVDLYFADWNYSFLKSEQRVMLRPPDTVGFARAIVEALIKGPQKGLLQTLPNGTALNALYITPDNVCYVDLSEAVRTNHPGGSNSELLTIYSVVNSLILNIPQIERVKILIDGNETSTLAGHIDLQYPIKAHMLIVR